MPLEEALQEHEERVDVLLKSAGGYIKALRAWKKACQAGHIASLIKAAGQAQELGAGLPEATAEARQSWQFDVRGFLESGEWRRELQAVAADKFFLRTIDDDDRLISSPVMVRAQPARGTLLLGKANWASIRPRVVAEELRRLRDKTAGANSQEFLESLLGAAIYLSNKDRPAARFRDIYDLFCLTPGYKKDNPTAAFAQQIYGMQKADIRTSRGGRKFEIDFPSGNVKERDIFPVISEDGRPLRYYSIWFS